MATAQPGPSNAAPAPENRKRRAEENVDEAAADADQPGTSQDAAADQPQDDSSSEGSEESDVDSSDDTDDVDSDDEDKQDEAQREPQIDPASLESETFENQPPEANELVWKDYLVQDDGDKKVRDHVLRVVSDPKPNDNEAVPRGIQSLYNSTTTDCALYAMFATNDTFDYLFKERKARFKDPVSVVRILKDYVVTPLRKIGFVGAKRTIALKLAMQRAGDLDMKSVIGERKVSEFISDLMESMNVEPQFYTVEVDQRGIDPRAIKVRRNPTYALDVDVKVQLIENDPVPYTSQQLIEQFTLDKRRKITNPRNLVLHLNRELSKSNDAVPVFPLRVISLLDSMTGVSRRCIICELVHNQTSEATLQCHTCFRIDDKHMQLKSCLYCDKCYKDVHEGAFASHESSPIFGPNYEELAENTVWETIAKTDKHSTATQIITDENGETTYQFELYAVICENLTGHVVYVSADVDLPGPMIEQYSYSCKEENQDPESTTEPPAAAPAPAPAPDPDATTKPKDPADAAKLQPAALSEASETMASTTSDTTMNSAEAGPSSGAPRKFKDEDLPVWLLFNPEEFVRDDARGGYNVPQVHTVTNFDDLINSNKSGALDPLDTDPVKQARYRVLCESIAMFYRPIMKTIPKPKPQDQPAESGTAEKVPSTDA